MIQLNQLSQDSLGTPEVDGGASSIADYSKEAVQAAVKGIMEAGKRFTIRYGVKRLNIPGGSSHKFFPYDQSPLGDPETTLKSPQHSEVDRVLGRDPQPSGGRMHLAKHVGILDRGTTPVNRYTDDSHMDTCDTFRDLPWEAWQVEFRNESEKRNPRKASIAVHA